MMPGGSTSVSSTLAASLVPLLVTVIVSTTRVPAVIVAGPTLSTDRSEAALTVVVTVSLLLLGSGSTVAAVTLAVLVTVPPADEVTVAMTTSSKVATAPTGSVGVEAVDVPEPPGVTVNDVAPDVC